QQGRGARRDPQRRGRCRPGRRREADRVGAGFRQDDGRGGPLPERAGALMHTLMHLLADAEFWVLIAVVVFAVAVWKPASRAITGMLDQRGAHIRAELDEAGRLREEAEQLLADFKRNESEAAAEAQAIIAP